MVTGLKQAQVYARALSTAVFKPRGSAVPDRSIDVSVTIDAAQVASFCHITRIPVNNVAPAPYLHTLGFMPGMELMTARDFPLPVLGMVHVFNSFTQHRPVMIGDEITLSVRMSTPRRRDRGTEIDVLVNATRNGELMFTETSTYFAKTHAVPSATADAKPSRLQTSQAEPAGLWRLEASLGERYARVSGDYNVIHLNGVLAKAFGFPRAIAHGMYTASRAFGALGVRAESFVWDVQFAKPILLPSTVAFGVERGAETVVAAVTRPKDGAPHVITHITGRDEPA